MADYEGAQHSGLAGAHEQASPGGEGGECGEDIVDPAARDYILSTILHNYSEDAALVLSTHLIGDIEKVLDEVILLHEGRVLRQAAVDELREETGESVDAYFREVYKC